MQHRATSELLAALPFSLAGSQIPRRQAVSLMKANSRHPSLQFKKIGERHGQEMWSARITLNHRALAIKRTHGFLWFWIGDHRAYEVLIS
jgi:hypothetical protein